MEKIRHELLNEIQGVVVQTCQRLKLNDEMCQKVGKTVVDFIGDNFAGQTIYFPMDLKLKIRHKDEEIYRKFTGDNISQLAREFGMSDSGIRKAIARTRKKLTV